MTTIIAELGSSPMPAWDFERWCAAAAAAGADAVKVQLFKVDAIYPAHMREDMRPREFPRKRLREFVQCAHAYGLTAGASVFDSEAVALAAEWCDWLKLAASQQGNIEFLDNVKLAAFRANKKLYRSFSDPQYFDALPGPRMTQLYAIQSYPAGMFRSIVNLLAYWRHLREWRWALRNDAAYRWGWSSHTTGIFDCVLAARLGASVVEKHFALSPADCEAPHSLLPDRYAAMCGAVRKGERHETKSQGR